ncbi:hypothetical protein GFH48_02605 [Streptomyces fagopyri]|uniref:Uncharacterized protein n=1 Tax=Streptomyces fagopyri TaxID=2662397 RepID=A0A5Q0L6V9_9ACTN|nr:hypothetical protein [Streptomyces fagopyri]QFZ72297.1 hypothetical protein GFH48_02605 [Streptomyces fagopyri]
MLYLTGTVTEAGPHPLTAWLLVRAWLAGLASATGIGLVRAVITNLVPGGGGLAGLVVLIVLGLCSACQVVASALLCRSVQQVRPARPRPLRTAVAILILGSAAMLTLNQVLCSGPRFVLPFGPLSLLLLCLPYPLAFALLAAPDLRTGVAVTAAGIAIAGTVFPLRTAQEHLAADAWRGHHSATDPRLLQAVDWPGGRQGTFTAGSYGVRLDVYFPNTNIDGFSEAVVTVSRSGTDPCGGVGVIAAYETVPSQDEFPDGQIITLPAKKCTPAGPNRWTLSGRGFTGYAERRDGVLIRLSVTSGHNGDDLPTIAGTLHVLDDHQLWSYLNTPLSPSWLLT